MSDTVTDTEAALVALLRANIPDPLGTVSRTWIWSGEMQPKARTPRIHIRRARGTVKPYISAGTKAMVKPTYELNVHVRIGDKGDVAGVIYTGTELLNRLVDKTANTLLANATTMGSNIVQFLPENVGGYAYDTASETYFNVVIANAKVLK